MNHATGLKQIRRIKKCYSVRRQQKKNCVCCSLLGRVVTWDLKQPDTSKTVSINFTRCHENCSLGSFLKCNIYLPFPMPESLVGDNKSVTENVLSPYERCSLNFLQDARNLFQNERNVSPQSLI